MGWFSWGKKKKKEPEIKEETKIPAEPQQEFGVWRDEDGQYRIHFSGGGELIVSRRMYSFMDHFAGKFMSLGSYNNEVLMKQIWQLLEQHGLGFVEDYEEPDDDGDDEGEVDPDSAPDPAEEVEEEVVNEPDPSVATVEAPSEAPAAVEGAHRNGSARPPREALPLRSR